MSQPTRACPICSTPLPGMAAYCYVCGTATPAGINRETGERVAVSQTTMTSAALRNRVQRALGPGYELKEKIGAGGFAEVYLAQDLRLKRQIAVKVLRPDLGLSPGMLERFRREAEVIAALRHPNIVPIFDVGEGEGVAFILMPFIKGESLRARIEREGKLPTAEVRRILREASGGLAAAHDAGVIHRDVKPENIMLEGRDARILLMDFGIAKAVVGEDEPESVSEDSSPALTSTGIIVGTPQYMSPEQACGDKSIDARTDQYSLAVVGYRMLSGSLPFEGESTRSVLYQQLVAEPMPITEKVADLPPGLAAAIGRAMRKEPRERFDDMHAFAEAVDQDAAPIELHPAGAKANLKSVTANHGRRNALLGALAAVVLVAVMLKVLPSGGSDEFVPSSVLGSTVDSGVDSGSATGPSQAPADLTPPATNGSRSATNRSAIPPAGRTGRSGAAPPVAAPSSAPVTPGPVAADCAALAGSNRWADAVTPCTAEAEAGNVVAMRTLAAMYNRGNGVAESPAQAFAWYRKAAPNDAAATYELSRMYGIGRGTPLDLRASVSQLREAARRGHQLATLELAGRLETGGNGIDRNYAESATWYRNAAEQGSSSAMLKLADYAARGRGMTKDEAVALEWYRKAGDAGSGEGAWQAAQAYLKGRGTAKDDAQAIVWLRKAAALNHAEASAELRKLAPT